MHGSEWSSGLQHGGPNVTDAGGRPSNVMLGYMFIAHFVMQSVLLVMCIVYGIVFYRVSTAQYNTTQPLPIAHL